MSGRKITGHERLIRLCVREDWVCWICQGEVPLDYEEDAPNAPTRDHYVPRARFRKGVKVNLQTNTRLAHKYCNNHRGTKKVRVSERELYAAGLAEAQEKFDLENMLPSSSGLGRGPLMPETGVQFP